MSIITKEIIDAIAYAFAPTEESMSQKQRADFHTAIKMVCDKELELAKIQQNITKVKTIGSLIIACDKKVDHDLVQELIEEFFKHM